MASLMARIRKWLGLSKKPQPTGSGENAGGGSEE
jgi:hypothetical protein